MADHSVKAVPALGVSYFTQPETGPVQFFACERLGANMTAQGCATRWTKAQHATGQMAERFEKCRACPIGAAHSGRTHVHLSPLHGAKLCPRCETGQMRIIAERVCVNCYNREREMLSGRNARGNAPARLQESRPLRSIRARMAINGRPAVRSFDNVTGLREVVLRSLRTTRGQVAFGWNGRADLRQGRLF
jgi:hypothetical protein